MKHLFTTTALLFSMTAFAQVGINNTSPKATLDITAKTTDGSKPEGLIIPQLTGDKIRIATTATPTPVYGTAQKGLIVYASTADSAPAGATASITAPGYYYFDGSAWQKIATGNTLNTSLANGNIYIGNTSNVATAVIPTGDVAISNTGSTSIGAGKVTNTHLASAAALTVKGNATNAAASPTDIAAGTDGYVLRRSGTSLGFGTVATAGIADGAVTTAKIATDAITSTQIATGAVSNTDLATAAALTVKGNATNAAASPTDIAAGTDGYVLRRSGTTLGFGTVDTAGITDGAVTTAKIASGAVTNADLASAAALTVKGNATNAAASPTDIAAGTDGYVLRRSGTVLGFGTVDTAGITDGAVTTAKIASGAVSNADLASAAALTVKGNATNAAASPTDIAAGTDGYVLRRSGTSLGFGTVVTAGIADGAVTTAKIQGSSTNGQVLTTNASGVTSWVTPVDNNTTYTGSTSINLNGTSFERTALTGDVTAATNSNATSIVEGKGGIYKGSGALSKNTVVDQGTNTLAFTSSPTSGTSHFTVDGTTLNVDALNNRVGIGTSSPGNLLEISSSSNNTGLKLPYGAAAGKILTSDAAGNSSWQTNNSVFVYSEIHSTGGSTSFSVGSLVNFFHTIKGENVKTIYGNSYGWIDATQRWVTPYTGKYRVTTNMYFNYNSSANPRVYAYINGSTACNVTSATNSGTQDGTAYTSAIVSLNQGDYLQWKTPTSTVLYGADYHTFIRVESVE